MKLVFATHNPNKVDELRDLLPDRFELLSLADIQYDQPIAETAPTLEGNARIKAQTVFDASGLPCLADDTGLFVEALDGAPGVHSARYAGHAADATANMTKLLGGLAPATNRKAFFKTVIAFVYEGSLYAFEGRVDGTIAMHPRGMKGFGYDPIFIPEGTDQTFGEMTSLEKNRISHRARAIQSFLYFLQTSDRV